MIKATKEVKDFVKWFDARDNDWQDANDLINQYETYLNAENPELSEFAKFISENDLSWETPNDLIEQFKRFKFEKEV